MNITIYNKIILFCFCALYIQACNNVQVPQKITVQHCITGVESYPRDTTIHDSKSTTMFSLEVDKSKLGKYKNGKFWLVNIHNDTIHTTGLNTRFFPSEPKDEIGYIFLDLDERKMNYNILDDFSIIYSSNEHYEVFNRSKKFSIRTRESFN